jgi:genome maintenance exonuclease 1
MQKRERDLFEHSVVDLGYEDLSTTQIDGKRHYVTPDKNYPSITTVLSVLSEKSINAWKKRIGEEAANKISYRASTRGTAVHELIEKYVNNDPNYLAGYMPNIVGNFLTVKDILDERIGTVFGQELPLYSDHLGVAGRVDCVAEFDGKISIIDYKTSRKPKLRKYIENYFQQETAYAIMWEERTGIPITQLVTIIAVDDEPAQVFIEHRDNWTKQLFETIELYKSTKL